MSKHDNWYRSMICFSTRYYDVTLVHVPKGTFGIMIPNIPKTIAPWYNTSIQYTVPGSTTTYLEGTSTGIIPSKVIPTYLGIAEVKVALVLQ